MIDAVNQALPVVQDALGYGMLAVLAGCAVLLARALWLARPVKR